MKLDIIGIDVPTVDIIQTPGGIIRSFGGSIVNSIIALQRLGMRTGLIVRIGNDKDGNGFLNEFDLLGVNRKQSIIDNRYRTPSCHIKIEGAERKIVSMDFTKPFQLSDIDENYLKSANSIYLRLEDNIFETCINAAKKNNMKIFISLHNTDISGKKELILNSGANVLFGNQNETKLIEPILEKLQDKNTIIVETEGKEGCIVFYKNGKKEYAGFRVDSKDTTGAGDAFAAGFIYGELRGWGIGKTAIFANAMGALATVEYGARTKNISFEEIQELIRSEKNAI